jgi:ribosomal protein S18 acetylase RimI-like enzyme
MSDMLVKLYALDYKFNEKLSLNGITIKKACIVDKEIILNFVKTNFPNEPAWVHECEYSLFNNPISCYLAVQNKEIIGFSCYDATAKGFFGPMGVSENYRKQGIGLELLLRALSSMKESGYAYAVIGWPARKAIEFYKKNVNAVEIDDSPPNKSIYKNSVLQE